MLLWDRQSVILQGKNVALNGFFDIRYGGLASFALRNTTWKAWTLGDPETIIAGINNRLSHAEKGTRRICENQSQMHANPRHTITRSLYYIYCVMLWLCV